MIRTTAGEVPLEADQNDYHRFVRQRLRWAFLLTLTAAFVLIILSHKPAARGVALGGLFSGLNFILLSRSLAGRVVRRDLPGRIWGIMWLLIRLAVLAVPLVIAARTDYFSLPAAAAGLFAVQAALLLEPLFKGFTRR